MPKVSADRSFTCVCVGRRPLDASPSAQPPTPTRCPNRRPRPVNIKEMFPMHVMASAPRQGSATSLRKLLVLGGVLVVISWGNYFSSTAISITFQYVSLIQSFKEYNPTRRDLCFQHELWFCTNFLKHLHTVSQLWDPEMQICFLL